jgi:glycosyltransferase involved in cell wall biosynthesis
VIEWATADPKDIDGNKVNHADEAWLLVIREGPTYSPDSLLRFLGETLSNSFHGEIQTHGPRAWTAQAGRFIIKCHAVRDPSGPAAKIPYMLSVVASALRRRWCERRRVVAIAYDPFRSGVVGLLIRVFSGATFICEVNGVYASEFNLVDIDNAERREKKRREMLRVGSFVLRRADAIKLLFKEQLTGFNLTGRSPMNVVFFDAVDISRFPAATQEPERILLFVGYPFLRKGVDLLLKAFAGLRHEFPDWRLVIIGWSIEEAAHRSGLPLDGVEFLGPRPVEEVSHWMRRSAILVLPSRSEAMGRVLIEAAASGRPRVAANVDGIPTVVRHEVDGLLFESGNDVDLKKQLTRLMRDPELARQLGRNARVRAESDFSSDRYVELYTNVIGALRGNCREQ